MPRTSNVFCSLARWVLVFISDLGFLNLVEVAQAAAEDGVAGVRRVPPETDMVTQRQKKLIDRLLLDRSFLDRSFLVKVSNWKVG